MIRAWSWRSGRLARLRARCGGRLLSACAVGVAATGLSLALYHRPWGAHFWFGSSPERAGFHVPFVAALAWLHAGAAYLGLVLFARWLFHRARSHGRSPGASEPNTGCLVATGLVAVLALASGHAVPWSDTLPWSDRPRLEPVRLEAADGPFPELVGVAPRYDLGARAGPRVITAVALFHAIVPLLGALLLYLCSRRGRAGGGDGAGREPPS